MGPLWVAKKPPDLHPLFPERGKPVESLGARGRSPGPTPCTVTPSSVQRQREGELCTRRRRSWGLWSWIVRGRVVVGGVQVFAGDDHIRALPLLEAGGQLLAQGLL